MGIDNKYGKITTEFGNIEDDEPVVVFRAKDILLPKVLMYYHLFCMKIGSPKQHLDLIMESLEKVKKWQHTNEARIPASQSHVDRVNTELNLK